MEKGEKKLVQFFPIYPGPKNYQTQVHRLELMGGDKNKV